MVVDYNVLVVELVAAGASCGAVLSTLLTGRERAVELEKGGGDEGGVRARWAS